MPLLHRSSSSSPAGTRRNKTLVSCIVCPAQPGGGLVRNLSHLEKVHSRARRLASSAVLPEKVGHGDFAGIGIIRGGRAGDRSHAHRSHLVRVVANERSCRPRDGDEAEDSGS